MPLNFASEIQRLVRTISWMERLSRGRRSKGAPPREISSRRRLGQGSKEAFERLKDAPNRMKYGRSTLKNQLEGRAWHANRDGIWRKAFGLRGSLGTAKGKHSPRSCRFEAISKKRLLASLPKAAPLNWNSDCAHGLHSSAGIPFWRTFETPKAGPWPAFMPCSSLERYDICETVSVSG